MTVSTAIAKIITTLASNEKGRKIIGAALLTPIVIILLGIGVFIALLTGLFSLLYGAVRDTSVSQSWNDIRKNVESALSGVNSSINTQVKNDTYSFMPDFSINLSKSVLQKTFSEGNSSFLLLYDTKEVNDSVAKAKKYIDKLKKVKSQKELEQLNEEIDLSSYKYSELAKDKEFRDDKSYDMSKYSQSTVQLINTLVKPEMPTYDYDEETVTIDGVKAKKQILTVHKDNKTQIVEYTCYGEGDIYLPRLLALYQAETFSRFEDMAESDASGLDNDIASAIENVSSDGSGGATADGFDVAQEVLPGAAEILTTTSGETPRSYRVYIEKVNDADPHRNMVLRVTDPALLAQTGGIVQGMSGSPILQNGRLVGAVTHVLVNDPTRGYGIFAQTMLEQAHSVSGTDAAA